MATKARETYDRYQNAIANGGSVMYNGVTITEANRLPTFAELAKGDPEAEAEAEAYLKEQQKALQAQLSALKGEEPTPEVEQLQAQVSTETQAADAIEEQAKEDKKKAEK